MNIYSKYNTPCNFYVYAYLRNDLTPYYIGKGSGSRAWADNRKHIRTPNDKYIVIVEHNLTEIGALAIERRLIHWYGRKDLGTGILRNMTDGGDGTTGHKGNTSPKSAETKAKISAANKGKKKPPMSDALKKQISEKLKGRPGHRKGRTGEYKHSDEAKQKIIESNKRRVVSAETRAKIAAGVRARNAQKK